MTSGPVSGKQVWWTNNAEEGQEEMFIRKYKIAHRTKEEQNKALGWERTSYNGNSKTLIMKE